MCVTVRVAGGMEAYAASEVAGSIVRLAAWSTVAVLLASPGAWAQTGTKLMGNVDQPRAGTSGLSWNEVSRAAANPQPAAVEECGSGMDNVHAGRSTRSIGCTARQRCTE